MKRGEVWVANLNPNRGQEIGKIRPVVVVQDDEVTATNIPTVLVLPLTTQVRRDYEPLRLTVKAREGLLQDSQVMVDQPRTLDRTRFGAGPLATLTGEEMSAIERSLEVVFGLLSGDGWEESPDIQPSSEAVEVSVVMPCLNEAESVGVCVEKAWKAIRAMGISGEVIVVDNGSTDGSPEIAERAGARIIHERRRGYGSAYLRGFAEARGRFLVMGDSDDSYDFLDVPNFIGALKDKGVDMVIGSRLKGKILPGAMPWSHRWIGNPILSGMLRLLFRTRVSDSHCGMRAFTRDAYERMRLQTTGMEFASEMVVGSLRAELKILEIPITYHPRVGESKLSGLRDAWRHVRFMLLFSPSYLFQLPGLLLMIVGGLLMALLAGGPRAIFGHTWDYHVLILGAAALILGYNLVLFDVFAKTFSMGAGFARPRQWLGRLHRGFSLERGLILGLALFLAGLGLEGKILLDWIRAGSGPLMAVRGVVIGMTAMVMGAQTVFASFLVSLMLIERR